VAEKKDIEKLIVQNKKSNLKNHWNDAFHYNTTKYSGEIKPNKLLIWRSSHFLRGSYPIFHLTFDTNNKLNGIKTEKNPYHKLLNKITIGILVIFILGLCLSTDFKTAIIGTVGIVVIGFLLRLVLGKSKKYETKLLADELKQDIEKLEQVNNPELINKPKSELKKEKVKEWTFTKVLTRLILYPFCLFILYLCFQMILNPDPNHPRQRPLGIFGIIVIGGYLVADITIIVKNLMNNKNYS
jgi:amino acid permease